jgi:hypothetical protein
MTNYYKIKDEYISNLKSAAHLLNIKLFFNMVMIFKKGMFKAYRFFAANTANEYCFFTIFLALINIRGETSF